MILKLKVWLLKKLLNDVSKHGHDGDVYLAHINKFEDKLLKTVGGEGSINPDTGLVQYKGGGGGGNQQTTNELDPNVVPYVKDALSKQQALYNEGAPDYYGGQTYLNPNTQQQQAINMMTANAGVNNPMLQNATNLNNQMIQGDFLQNNPNFDAVMNTAGRKATDLYNTATQSTMGNVSQAGRYGSNAHARLASNNSSNLAQSLADTAGQYSYQNYANERGNQINAMNNAGAIAGNQNIGAQNLMNAGNAQAGFDQTALNADIARHDYGQNAQQQHLSNYTNAVWGAPGGSTSTTSSSGGGK
jgi:hypothetical protein